LGKIRGEKLMRKNRSGLVVLVAGLMLALLLAACQPAAQATQGVDAPAATEAGGEQMPETGGTEVGETVGGTPAGDTAAACEAGMTMEELQSTGATVYASTCAGCHGPQGEGQGDFPPLANSELANTQDLVEMAQTVADPEVHPFITTINAQDLAAALTFVRSSFGNNAPLVCPEDIPLPASQ
jgi:mono/diheme cytochrome c family protein